MDIRKLLKAGHAALSAEHNSASADKAGHPRIGSAGIVTPEGEVYGTCHRKALARSLGIEAPQDLSTDIMWKAGESNEWHWERILGRGYTEGKILKHSDVPVRASIPGVPLDVLGHPDVILGDVVGNPIMGLELKGIFGSSTAVSVELEGVPKNDNLIQAAAYSYFLQLPYALCYTSSAWVPVHVFDQKKYGLKNILPFYRIFYMEWRDDVLHYRDERSDIWVKTIITPQGIQDYYRLIEEMKAKKVLGPRPITNYVHGGKDKWGPNGSCGLCEFKVACGFYDVTSDYDDWIDRITLLSKEKELLSDESI